MEGWKVNTCIIEYCDHCNVIMELYFIRSAAAIRTACMTCLQILLQEKLLSIKFLSEVHSELLPQVFNLQYIHT